MGEPEGRVCDRVMRVSLLAGWWIAPLLTLVVASTLAGLCASGLQRDTTLVSLSPNLRDRLPAITFFAALVALYPACGKTRQAIDQRLRGYELLGSAIALEFTGLGIESERDFNGDGNSVHLYRVPPGTLARVLARGDTFHRSPTMGIRDAPWQVVTWRRGLPDARSQAAINFVIPGRCGGVASRMFGRRSERGCQQVLDAVRTALHRPETFIAYRYKRHPDSVGFANVDLFIFDTVSNLLISGNTNT